MELAVGLRHLRLRDGGRQRHAKPGIRAPVEHVLWGEGGEGRRLALPPLPHVVHGPPVAGRWEALVEARRGGIRHGRGHTALSGLVVRGRSPDSRGRRWNRGGQGRAPSARGLMPPGRPTLRGRRPGVRQRRATAFRMPRGADRAARNEGCGEGHKKGQRPEVEQSPVHTALGAAAAQGTAPSHTARGSTFWRHIPLVCSTLQPSTHVHMACTSPMAGRKGGPPP